MNDRQLIADLLSALEYHTEQTRPIEFSRVAIEAAREYLRKPAQQEPVGQLMEEAYGRGQVLWFNKPDDFSMLYPSPPASKPWVGLTDGEIAETCGFGEHTTTSTCITFTHLARAIEAKLREKNT